MRAWMIVCVAVLATVAGCKQKDCPAAPPCPKVECPQPVDGGAGEDLAAPVFRIIEGANGNKAFVGTVDGKDVVVPIDPAKTRVFDAAAPTAPTTADKLLAAPGSCPCRLPVCQPYCRKAAAVVDQPPADFLGYEPGGALPAPGSGGPAAPAPQ